MVPPSGSATILIAEDEAHILRVMSMWLSRNGFNLIETHDGAEALERLRQSHVDLIISDMNMPEMDGLELARAVRCELKSDVPMLLLTARCDQTSLADALAPYDVQIYPKPFVPSQLVADVKQALEAVVTGDRA